MNKLKLILSVILLLLVIWVPAYIIYICPVWTVTPAVMTLLFGVVYASWLVIYYTATEFESPIVFKQVEDTR